MKSKKKNIKKVKRKLNVSKLKQNRRFSCKINKRIRGGTPDVGSLQGEKCGICWNRTNCGICVFKCGEPKHYLCVICSVDYCLTNDKCPYCRREIDITKLESVKLLNVTTLQRAGYFFKPYLTRMKAIIDNHLEERRENARILALQRRGREQLDAVNSMIFFISIFGTIICSPTIFMIISLFAENGIHTKTYNGIVGIIDFFNYSFTIRMGGGLTDDSTIKTYSFEFKETCYNPEWQEPFDKLWSEIELSKDIPILIEIVEKMDKEDDIEIKLKQEIQKHPLYEKYKDSFKKKLIT